MPALKNQSGWKKYSDAGGVGLGTLAIYFSSYLEDGIGKDILIFISPTLTFISSKVFQKLEVYINYKLFLRKVDVTKKNIKLLLDDPTISDSKKADLQSEYDKLCVLEIDELMHQIDKVSAVKKN